MTNDDSTKRMAIYMLKNGHATPAEVANLFGRSRQIVLHWSKGTDWRSARAARLARFKERAERQV